MRSRLVTATLILLTLLPTTLLAQSSETSSIRWHGQAGVGDRTVNHFENNSTTYIYRIAFRIIEFPAPLDRQHDAPTFGAMLRFDPDTANPDCLYIKSLRTSDPGQPTQIVFGREEKDIDEKFFSVDFDWHWQLDTSYEWVIEDDGSNVSMWINMPGAIDDIHVLDRVAYDSSVVTKNKGLFVQDGTSVMFEASVTNPTPVTQTTWAQVKAYHH